MREGSGGEVGVGGGDWMFISLWLVLFYHRRQTSLLLG
jgi:hypothetical protein